MNSSSVLRSFVPAMCCILLGWGASPVTHADELHNMAEKAGFKRCATEIADIEKRFLVDANGTSADGNEASQGNDRPLVVVVTGKDMEKVPFQLAATLIPRGTTGCDWILQESRVETGHCNTALQKREGAYKYVGPWGEGIIAMEDTDGRKAILFTPTADVGSCLVTTRELHLGP